ncbi:MAG: hypothetical protein KGI70_01725 [Patescibacteria group bacterium]|nr:hypothetical protein [Patescibacteria group bacterium]
MAQIEVDYPRIRDVCALLIESLRQHKFPYNVTKPPQEYVPAEIRADPLVHALVLFGTCHFMRGTIQSDFAIRQMVKIWRTHPELFDPVFLSTKQATKQYVFDRLKPFLMYRLFEIPKLWLGNFKRLERDWSGDPRRIFDGVTNADEMYRRVVNKNSSSKYRTMPGKLEGFVGFREKVASMLAYFLMDSKLIPEFPVSTPVDFHNLRVFFATEGMRYANGDGTKLRYETAAAVAVPLVERLVKEQGYSMVELGDALWLQSVGACRYAPGNKTLGRLKSGQKNEGRHRLEYKPQARQELNVQFYTPDWQDPTDVHKHELTCGRCQLRGLCTMNVASGFYYEDGNIMMRARTEPMSNLFGELHYHAPEERESPPQPEQEKIALPLLPGEWPEQKKTPRA